MGECERGKREEKEGECLRVEMKEGWGRFSQISHARPQSAPGVFISKHRGHLQTFIFIFNH